MILNRVLIDIPKIQNHDKNKITCRFFESSFDLKILEFNNKNYAFSVPRT